MNGNGWVLGIDLGTTNTSAVAYGPGSREPITILFGRDSPVLPSVVSFKNPQLPVIGWLAKEMILTDPLTTIHGWKRLLGRPPHSEYVSRYRNRFPFEIVADARGDLGAQCAGRFVSFVEVASLILDQVRLQAHAKTGVSITDCVITVPAHFAAAQREAVRRAAEQANLHVLRLVNEPTAAALAYCETRRVDGRVLVFDFGGGTFDATVLDRLDNIFDVSATQGDGFLGGIDLDRAVFHKLVEHTRDALGIDLTHDPVVAQRVLSAAENAKCVLSGRESVRIHVPMIGFGRNGRFADLDVEMRREELDALTAVFIERAIGVAEQTVELARIEKHDLAAILLVGGQSRMPLVQRRVADAFGIEPRSDFDPFTAVAHGAALVARSYEDLAGAILIDVLSVPIGVVFSGGRTQLAFESNRTLPAEAHVEIEPPGKDELIIGVWQGADVTSPDRQVLGICKIPAVLFRGGTRWRLRLRLSEEQKLAAYFESDVRTEALALELPGGATSHAPAMPSRASTTGPMPAVVGAAARTPPGGSRMPKLPPALVTAKKSTPAPFTPKPVVPPAAPVPAAAPGFAASPLSPAAPVAVALAQPIAAPSQPPVAPAPEELDDLLRNYDPDFERTEKVKPPPATGSTPLRSRSMRRAARWLGVAAACAACALAGMLLGRMAPETSGQAVPPQRVEKQALDPKRLAEIEDLLARVRRSPHDTVLVGELGNRLLEALDDLPESSEKQELKSSAIAGGRKGDVRGLEASVETLRKLSPAQ